MSGAVTWDVAQFAQSVLIALLAVVFFGIACWAASPPGNGGHGPWPPLY